MMKAKLVLCASLFALGACGDAAGGKDSGAEEANDDKDAGASEEDDSLCAKYGGADNIEKVIKEQVVGEIAGDCRINTFFTSLSSAGLMRVSDCLAIQAQELFGCPGIKYTGAKAANGLACRDMVTAHKGLAISQGDFDALIEDVVAGLTKAGVSEDDIGMAAPALLGLAPSIVEKKSQTDASKDICDAKGD